MSDTRSWALSCHLGSLSLVSCRSRAEALARRLRTKLESSLGRNGDVVVTNRPLEGAPETLHLLAASRAQPSHLYPQQLPEAPRGALSQRDEEELFYDFDLASPDVADDLVTCRHHHHHPSLPLPFVMGPACTRQPRPNSNHPHFAKWSTPTSPVWSPMEEARESAYCSGGELDGRALEQGQHDLWRGRIGLSDDGSSSSTTLALADTTDEEDEDDYEEVFSECRESAGEEDEVESWKEALAEFVVRPHVVVRTMTRDEWETNEENHAKEGTPVNDEGNGNKRMQNGDEVGGWNSVTLGAGDEQVKETSERQEEVAVVDAVHRSEAIDKVKQLLYTVEDEIDAAIGSGDVFSCSVETETLRTDAVWGECVDENVCRTENENDESILEEFVVKDSDAGRTVIDDDDQLVVCSDTQATKVNVKLLDDSSKSSIENERDETEAGVEEQPDDLCIEDPTGVFEFLFVPEGKDKHDEEKQYEEEEEEEEEEDNDDEEFLHSPTWGMLKQIDRFQVRKLVQECEEGSKNGDNGHISPETTEDHGAHASATLQNMPLETQQPGSDRITVLGQVPRKSVVPSPLSPIRVRIDPSEACPEEKTRRISRSSSLKTGRTPPNTPGLKKIVRFADVLGLDLEDVRHVFLEDLPTVPMSAYEDLDAEAVESKTEPSEQDTCPASTEPVPIPGARTPIPTKTLIAMFSQPSDSQSDLVDRVRRHKVCLENAYYCESAVRGHVRVFNMAFQKMVHVRYTLNEWKSFFDLEAAYLPQSTQDGETERFAFCIFGGDTLGFGERLVFCIRYTSNDQDFWDNNHGNNYFFQCIQESTPLPPSPVDNWIHFL